MAMVPADDEFNGVLDRIDALMRELTRLRSRLEHAQKRELEVPPRGAERRRGERRKGPDRRRQPSLPESS